MTKLQHKFTGGKMNLDIDERLLQNGDYPYAENLRVVNSGSGNLGSVENHLGNKQLTNLGLLDGKTIGALVDNSNYKIYYFVTSATEDMVLEWDDVNQQSTIILHSAKPGVLNFDEAYPITGVNKIINGDPNKDLLAWTDNRNPPRMINIERSKLYGFNGFDEDDISVIKRPPKYPPEVQLTYTTTQQENNLSERFILVAYRYKMLDGQYTALSPWSYYMFSPTGLKLDYQSYENLGMVNSFNALNIKFPTGDHRVTDIQLVFKESNSNTMYIAETFNKVEQGWADNVERTFLFSNSKTYATLPEAENYRVYDNVPLLARAQEYMGNRLIYGNYVENYDMLDQYGQPVVLEYSLGLKSTPLIGKVLPITISSSTADPTRKDQMVIDFTDISLSKGNRITFDIYISDALNTGRFDLSIDYILNEDYATVSDLVAATEFINFVTVALTTNFTTNYSLTLPANTVVDSVTPFQATASGNSLILKSPVVVLKTDLTPSNPSDSSFSFTNSVWAYGTLSAAFYKLFTTGASLKSNRSYEVGIKYADSYNRSSYPQTVWGNTVFVPHSASDSQNRIQVSINHLPPAWADRYQFVIKQNKAEYQTIYANLFYEDGLYRWIKLEGENRSKVEDLETLIIKSDLSGVVTTLEKVKVLEKAYKDRNFIDGNFYNGVEVNELSGTYIKIKAPIGVDISYRPDSFLKGEGRASRRGDNFRAYIGEFSTYDPDTNTYSDIEITAGSKIEIELINEKGGSSGGYERFFKEYIVGNTYNNISDWWDAEGGDTTPFNDVYWVKGRSQGNNQFASPVVLEDPTGAWYFSVKNVLNGNGQNRSFLRGSITINKSAGLLVFETEPKDIQDVIYYEDAEIFEIDGMHKGNIQDQTALLPAICELGIFNCYAMGSGVESYRIKDNFTSKWLSMDYRPALASREKFKRIMRFADLTWSNVYNENTNVNGLSTFNLYTANYKEDIDKRYGSIQKLFSRDSNLLLFQEDKVSQVLYGKDVLTKADGSADITSSPDVLGKVIPYTGEYGISTNPESFAFRAGYVYFTDRKRGVPLRLAGDGITEINKGTINFFREQFRGSPLARHMGAVDPEYLQYVLTTGGKDYNLPLTIDCKQSFVRNNFSGTMDVFIDYGTLVGDAGFSYITNGIPVRFAITWGSNTYTTGFVGDPSYNSALANLGYPAVSGPGTGTFTFDKLTPVDTSIKVTIFTPFQDVKFQVSGICVLNKNKNVTMIVANQPAYANSAATHRFRWIRNTYVSPFKSSDVPFTSGPVTLFDTVSGPVSSGYIPAETTPGNVTSVLIQVVTSPSEPDLFDGGRIRYLFSNTNYGVLGVPTIRSLSTLVSPSSITSVTQPDGSVIHSFLLNLGVDYGNNTNLYIMFDYFDPPVAVDDVTSVTLGGTVDIDVLDNDYDPNGLPLTPVIDTPPLNGTVTILPSKLIRYDHDGSPELTDEFTYHVTNGTSNSNIATVSLNIDSGCTAGDTELTGSGTLIEDFILDYGAVVSPNLGLTYTVTSGQLDLIQVLHNGVTVLTIPGPILPGVETVLFEKPTAYPTSVIIRVTPNSETINNYTLIGICPAV